MKEYGTAATGAVLTSLRRELMQIILVLLDDSSCIRLFMAGTAHAVTATVAVDSRRSLFLSRPTTYSEKCVLTFTFFHNCLPYYCPYLAEYCSQPVTHLAAGRRADDGGMPPILHPMFMSAL